jgi:hypothetical protein
MNDVIGWMERKRFMQRKERKRKINRGKVCEKEDEQKKIYNTNRENQILIELAGEERETERQRGREAERQRGREAEIQGDKDAERQKERKRNRGNSCLSVSAKTVLLMCVLLSSLASCCSR